MNDLITIIMPTHNRPYALLRALKYYNDAGIRLLVADSSDKAFEGVDQFNAEYFHLPDMRFYEKLNYLVAKVETKYTLFASDDDFTLINSVRQCVIFLENHDDYSAAQGETLLYRVTVAGAVTLMPALHWVFGKDDFNMADTWCRVNDGFNDTVSSFYGVRRTALVRRSLALIDQYKISDCILCEMVHYFCDYFAGGIKILPILFQCRSWMPREKSDENLNLACSLQLAEKKQFLALMRDQLRILYSEVELESKGGIDALLSIITRWDGGVSSKNSNTRRIKWRARLLYRDYMQYTKLPKDVYRKFGLRLNKGAAKEWNFLVLYIKDNILPFEKASSSCSRPVRLVRSFLRLFFLAYK